LRDASAYCVHAKRRPAGDVHTLAGEPAHILIHYIFFRFRSAFRKLKRNLDALTTEINNASGASVNTGAEAAKEVIDSNPLERALVRAIDDLNAGLEEARLLDALADGVDYSVGLVGRKGAKTSGGFDVERGGGFLGFGHAATDGGEERLKRASSRRGGVGEGRETG
jgi:hypothetical protein